MVLAFTLANPFCELASTQLWGGAGEELGRSRGGAREKLGRSQGGAGEELGRS